MSNFIAVSLISISSLKNDNLELKYARVDQLYSSFKIIQSFYASHLSVRQYMKACTFTVNDFSQVFCFGIKTLGG